MFSIREPNLPWELCPKSRIFGSNVTFKVTANYTGTGLIHKVRNLYTICASADNIDSRFLVRSRTQDALWRGVLLKLAPGLVKDKNMFLDGPNLVNFEQQRQSSDQSA